MYIFIINKYGTRVLHCVKCLIQVRYLVYVISVISVTTKIIHTFDERKVELILLYNFHRKWVIICV